MMLENSFTEPENFKGMLEKNQQYAKFEDLIKTGSGSEFLNDEMSMLYKSCDISLIIEEKEIISEPISQN